MISTLCSLCLLLLVKFCASAGENKDYDDVMINGKMVDSNEDYGKQLTIDHCHKYIQYIKHFRLC